jgi:hypothetical protein
MARLGHTHDCTRDEWLRVWGGDPGGIRTPVRSVKGSRARPLHYRVALRNDFIIRPGRLRTAGRAVRIAPSWCCSGSRAARGYDQWSGRDRRQGDGPYRRIRGKWRNGLPEGTACRSTASPRSRLALRDARRHRWPNMIGILTGLPLSYRTLRRGPIGGDKRALRRADCGNRCEDRLVRFRCATALSTKPERRSLRIALLLPDRLAPPTPRLTAGGASSSHAESV